MKITQILSLFLVFPLSAVNYIDNPNFDAETAGWASNPAIFGHLNGYSEHNRGVIIKDRYLGASGSSNGLIFYSMNDVPEKLPLSFVVEIGLTDDQPLDVKVELVEELKRKYEGRDCDEWENTQRQDWAIRWPSFLKGCESQPKEALLSAKSMQFVGKDVWHVISSDYPAYKKHADSKLEFRIIKSSEAGTIQINYAQVGTDPRALGGRGARKKNFNKKDEL